MRLQKLLHHIRRLAAIVIAAGFGILLVAVHAASLTAPTSQPLNFIAAPDLSDYDIGSGTSVGFTPWFENATWQGDLVAATISSTGNIGTTVWMARAKFAAAEGASPETSTYWNNRVIVTTDGGHGSGWTGNVPGANNKVPFRYNDYTANPTPTAGTVLHTVQVSAIGTGDKVNYVRGKRSQEIQYGGILRSRPDTTASGIKKSGILGDIIHSRPVYVGPPRQNYTFNNYSAFKATARDARVYVGANDGMVHAFNATGDSTAYGKEVFGYVPSMVVPNLGKLSVNPYVHTYFADGELTVGDAYIDTSDGAGIKWHSVLVGGLGAGGKGFFALDVTVPVASGATEAQAKAKILWEIGAPNATPDTDLGYTFSRPIIVKLKTGQWVAIAGNGYDSTDGKPVLYIVDLVSGQVAKAYADTTAGSATDKNGLSSPTHLDTNNDSIADYVYAGDINGNMWRFDLTGVATNPLTTAAAASQITQYKLYSGSANQPITAAPGAAGHPEGGYMVFFGTGRAFNNTDVADTTNIQAIYGIRDQGFAIASPQLVTQTLAATTYPNPSANIRVCTSKTIVSYTVKDGWKVNLPAGERLLTLMQYRADRAQFTTANTTTTTYENWVTQLDYLTGCEPQGSVFDLSGNGVLDDADAIDYGSNQSLDYPVAKKLSTGITPIQLASHPVIAYVTSGLDTVLLNNEGVPATPVTACTINCSDGFKGGHIDVDTDSPSGGSNAAGSDGLGGTTDGHVHKYDTKNKQVYVDYFSLEPRRGLAGGSDSLNRVTEAYQRGTGITTFGNTQKFLVLLANADLSTGGKITIGSAAAVAVKTYQDALISKIKAGIAGASSGDYTGALSSSDLHTLDELLGTTLTGNNPLAEVTPSTTIPGALRVSFEDTSIQTGGLMPTNTSCVKDSVNITNGRWRNGALTLQLLAVPDGLTAQINAHVAANTRIQPDDTATSVVENTGVTLPVPPTSSDVQFLYESTLFWHWNDDVSEATATITVLLADPSLENKVKPPCYGDPNYSTIRSAVNNGLTASQLSALDAELANLDPKSKRYKTLSKAKSNYVASGGGGGVVVTSPANTEGGLQSGGPTTGSTIYTGSRSWVEIGAD